MSDAPTFVQVSGGRTSGYMAYLLKDKPNHFFMFQNTGRERPETYDFINKMDKEFRLNLIWLEYHCPEPTKKAGFKVVNYETTNRESVPFEQLIEKRKAIPNKFKRFCTIEMKVKTARRWIRAQGLLRWNYAIGYRVDEPKRKVRSDTMQRAVTPLRDLGVTIKDVSKFWKSSNFDLDLEMLPNGKTFGGNCMGCFWHSEYQNAHLCANRPKDVDWLIKQEKRWGFTFNDGFSFEELSNKPKDLLSLVEHYCTETNGSCGS